MTLTELLYSIRHYLRLFIIVILIGFVIGCVFGFIKYSNSMEDFEIASESKNYSGEFMANSTVLVSGKVKGISGIAEAEASSWNYDNNDERYGDWLASENTRMHEQLKKSSNTSAKKNFESTPGSWLRSDDAKDYVDLTIVEVKTDDDANSISIYAIGPDPQLCINACNDVASDTESIADNMYNLDKKDALSIALDESSKAVLEENIIKIEIVKAVKAIPAFPVVDDNASLITANKTSTSTDTDDAPSKLKTLLKYGGVGLVGGIFAAIILIALIVYFRKPILGSSLEKREITEPILLMPGNKASDNLLQVNIQLAAGKDSSQIAIASVNDQTASASVYKRLENQSGSDRLHFEDTGSLTSSGEAVEAASKADGVVLCMREWKDTIAELEDALNELKIANAHIIGIAVLG